MTNYEEFLNTFNIEQLKNIFRSIKNKRYIITANKTKKQLINDLLKHTEMKNNEIEAKEEHIKDLSKEKKKFNDKKTSELVGKTGRHRGEIDKLEEDIFREKYDDDLYYTGKTKSNNPRKDKDEDLIKDLEEKLKKAKEDLKNAIKKYKQHKQNIKKEF